MLVDDDHTVACVGYDFATTICLNDVIEQATNALHVSMIYDFCSEKLNEICEI